MPLRGGRGWFSPYPLPSPSPRGEGETGGGSLWPSVRPRPTVAPAARFSASPCLRISASPDFRLIVHLQERVAANTSLLKSVCDHFCKSCYPLNRNSAFT